MNKIDIKPLSVNKAWRGGRRYCTNDYKEFEKELWHLLPKKNLPDGKLGLKVEFGIANTRADTDNFLKPFIDICQKKYIFNDNRVFKIEATKKIVKKEYIKFEFYAYDKTT